MSTDSPNKRKHSIENTHRHDVKRAAIAAGTQEPCKKTTTASDTRRPSHHTKDTILQTARESQFTDAVQVLSPRKPRHRLEKGKHPIHNVRIITSCRRTVSSNKRKELKSLEIFIKPLLVLDLNGILCFRIRRRNDTPNTSYRDALEGKPIAMTPVVPRPDLESFLVLLDKHFCLAIWTSAKAKTAKALVRALIPECVSQHLLFIWAQHDCSMESEECVAPTQGTESTADVVFTKDLGKVWDKYPLWNQTNTLIVDDSPKKCSAWVRNAVHPPALNGLVGEDDASNVSAQTEFFKKLVDHWVHHSTTRELDPERGDEEDVFNENKLLEFLQKHATGHMGWVDTTCTTDSL